MGKKTTMVFFLMLFAAGHLWSQSLYGTGISPDSALVRVIYADETSGKTIEIGSESFSSDRWEESALYHPVAPGMYFFEMGSQWIEVIPMSGLYYTLIIQGETCFVFEDMEHTIPAKNQIYFYNILDDETASLFVSASGDMLFKETEPGESVQMAVNPLDIDFALSTSDDRNIGLGSLPMNRGGSTTVIALENEGELDFLVFQADVKKEN